MRCILCHSSLFFGAKGGLSGQKLALEHPNLSHGSNLRDFIIREKRKEGWRVSEPIPLAILFS